MTTKYPESTDSWSPRPETSLRHPHVSVEDTIAMKLQSLIEATHIEGTFRPEGMRIAREIVTDIKALIHQEMTPPEPEPSVLDEKDLTIHLYRAGMRDWGLRIMHCPTGQVVNRSSTDLDEHEQPRWKSQLQARADAMAELEGRVRAHLAR